jgi:hypothetical protein
MAHGTRRNAAEGHLLNSEADLVAVQLEKLHPFYAHSNDIGTEVDWVKDVMPKRAQRETEALRVIVLAKGLIKQVVDNYADQISKPLYERLRQGMRCFSAQGVKTIAIGHDQGRESSFRAAENRQQVVKPYLSAFVPLGREKDRLTTEAKAAQAAYEAAEAKRAKGSGTAPSPAPAPAPSSSGKGQNRKRKKKQRQRKRAAKKNAAARKAKASRAKRGTRSGGSSSAPTQSSASGGDSGPRQCFRCGSTKHEIRDCPVSRVDKKGKGDKSDRGGGRGRGRGKGVLGGMGMGPKGMGGKPGPSVTFYKDSLKQK